MDCGNFEGLRYLKIIPEASSSARREEELDTGWLADLDVFAMSGTATDKKSEVRSRPEWSSTRSNAGSHLLGYGMDVEMLE